MANFNKVIITGVSKEDPNIGFNANGAVVTFPLIVGTATYLVEAYKTIAETIGSEITAGEKVLVCGRMGTRKIERDGQNVTELFIRASKAVPCITSGTYAEINTVITEGRLAADPEVTYTKNGKAVAKFDLAVGRYGRDAGADFFKTVSWENTAENVGNNLAKGRRVLIEGKLSQRDYESRDGRNITTNEIVVNEVTFLESKLSNNPNTTSNSSNYEEEIPF